MKKPFQKKPKEIKEETREIKAQLVFQVKKEVKEKTALQETKVIRVLQGNGEAGALLVIKALPVKLVQKEKKD